MIMPLYCLAQEQNSIEAIIDVGSEIRTGENLEFTYLIKSTVTQAIQYIPKIECPNAPAAILDKKNLDLKAGQGYQDRYFSMKIENFVEPQNCLAVIEITEPSEKIFQKEFKIVADPSLKVDVGSCKEAECVNQTKVFKIGETAFFYALTGKIKTTAAAEIISPENSKETIDLPGSYKFSEKGEYTITITTEALGYKKNIQSFPITVLEGDAKVNDSRICQVNGHCDGQETSQNCPADCVLPPRKAFLSSPYFFFATIAAGVILLIIAVLLILKKTGSKQ